MIANGISQYCHISIHDKLFPCIYLHRTSQGGDGIAKMDINHFVNVDYTFVYIKPIRPHAINSPIYNLSHSFSITIFITQLL